MIGKAEVGYLLVYSISTNFFSVAVNITMYEKRNDRYLSHLRYNPIKLKTDDCVLIFFIFRIIITKTIPKCILSQKI